ncbi:hypothetical protein D9M72_512830 [compost metagenome]
MHLLFAPLLACVVLVKAGEVAVVALVERLVADRFERGLADGVEHELAGALGTDEVRGEGDVELDAIFGKRLAAGPGFRDAEFRQVRITPAGKQVLQVPVALAMPDKDEGAAHVEFPLRLESGKVS